MHVHFSGIGAGIGPLALLAHEAGYTVTGSDKQLNSYVNYLKKHGISDIHIGQTKEAIAALHAREPIDWFVYSSALPKENPQHPELLFVQKNGIKHSKRDDFLNYFLAEKGLKMIAIAGTHGKTTTTAMAIWALKQLGVPVSYSVGAKLSFGTMAEYDPASKYFVYECDEYDRNFLQFHPSISLITGIDWDHADVFPTRENYQAAFAEFVSQSHNVVLWQEDVPSVSQAQPGGEQLTLSEDDIPTALTLPGLVNRRNAWQVACAFEAFLDQPAGELLVALNAFPGVSRRFEAIASGLYTDYAHTPRKIEGALQLAHEVAGNDVVVVYEGLHNTRQHFIKDEFKHLFNSVKHLYVVPSYLAREDPSLPLLTPADISALTPLGGKATAAELNDELKAAIDRHLEQKELVLCLSAGSGNSLDEWLRKNYHAAQEG